MSDFIQRKIDFNKEKKKRKNKFSQITEKNRYCIVAHVEKKRRREKPKKGKNSKKSKWPKMSKILKKGAK